MSQNYQEKFPAQLTISFQINDEKAFKAAFPGLKELTETPFDPEAPFTVSGVSLSDEIKRSLIIDALMQRYKNNDSFLVELIQDALEVQSIGEMNAILNTIADESEIKENETNTLSP